jgi:mannose-1-phosphate guanylyltransferase/mannose-6-phosphate isomerase
VRQQLALSRKPKEIKLINVVPVILCGGSGTRLWPLSRAGFPKQFLVLSGTTSLFQQAIERVNGLAADDIAVGETLIVTGEEHRFIALDQLREMQGIKATLLLEPSARNTAPALTFAALQAVKDGNDPILVVTPADQTVQDPMRFTDALQRSIRVAASGSIVILGITPDKPETGYGYIKRQGAVGAMGEYAVAQFAEKPDLETAIAYFEAGDYAWNGGMFVVRASIWLKALKEFRPDILDAAEKACGIETLDTPFVRPDKSLFSNIPSESIDYAVMEKCSGSGIDIKMVPLDAGWNDLGAWDAVWQVGQADLNGNVTNGDTLLADTTNTYVHSSSRLVSTVGVNNLVVIETADAVLIADKSQSQNVKKIVNLLVEVNRQENTLHRKVHRPWGWYDTIDEGDRFKVKRIQVNPGGSLSLQKHTHRAEHWVVIKGTAEITNGEQVMTLSENQSTYIPSGTIHRLSNPGNISLEIIEVQSGSYVGEDDIERIEDIYGREL